MKELEIYDRGCAAYLLAIGIPLIQVIPGDWHRYRFADTNGKAGDALQHWREGTAVVQARTYWEAFRELKKALYTTTTSSRQSAGVKYDRDTTGAV